MPSHAPAPDGLDALAEPLVEVPPDRFSALVPFVPDTPWTTTPLHVLQRRQGRAFADSETLPRSVVVLACGDPGTRTLDRAYLFGTASSESLRRFVASITVPVELICDGEVAEIVRAEHPDARMKQFVVLWYDQVAEAQAVAAETTPRRLRISESDNLAPLVPPGDLRTFRTVRDLVTGGSAFVIDDQGQVVSAAYSVDHSVRFERMTASTREHVRKAGLAGLVARRLVKCIAEQGRIPCAIVERTDTAGLAAAAKLGFTQKAQMRSFTTRLRS